MDSKNFSDTDQPSQRFGRYATQARALGGLLTRIMTEKIGLPFHHEPYAEVLTKRLGDLKGPAMKIGQLLVTVPGLLPEEYAESFLSLQAHAPPMGPLFVRRRMRMELGESWEKNFLTFDQKASFAASLGQIHRAQSLQGDSLACKLQYPHMEEVVRQDLKQLSLFCTLYEKWGGGIKTDSFQVEVEERLLEELDYQQEKRHISWFQKALSSEPSIRVPAVFPHLTTKRLLTMEWLSGEPFIHFESADLKAREKLGKRLFRAWYKPFYHFGLIHGDPHLGNYTISPERDFQLNLLDFGCVRVFEPRVVCGVIRLYQALRQRSQACLKEAYHMLGFETLDDETLEILNLWAQFLYAPLLEDRVRPITETFSSEEGKTVAAEVHKRLRQRGGIHPPRAFVFLDRAAVGIGSALMRLRVCLNWHQLFEELIQNVSLETISKQQQSLPLFPEVRS